MSGKKAFGIAWHIMILSMLIVFFSPRLESVFLSLLLGEVMILIPICLGIFLLKLGGDTDIKKLLGINPLKKEYILWIILLTITFKFYSPTIMSGVEALLVTLFEEPDYILPKSNIGSVFVLCIVAPVIEEILSRGVIFSLFKKTGNLSALIFSSLGFSLMHLDIVSVIPIFFMGLLLGILRLSTGSIIAPIIAHSLSNLFAFIMLKTEIYNSTAITLTAIGMVLFPIILWRFLERFNVGEKIAMKIKIPGVSFGMVLSILLFLGFNIYKFLFNV